MTATLLERLKLSLYQYVDLREQGWRQSESHAYHCDRCMGADYWDEGCDSDNFTECNHEDRFFWLHVEDRLREHPIAPSYTQVTDIVCEDCLAKALPLIVYEIPEDPF